MTSSSEPSTAGPVHAEWESVDVPLVLHVIPTGQARGAQREARALADHLDAPGIRHHRVLSLFAGRDEVTVDRGLDYPGGGAPAIGFDPGLVLKLRSALVAMDPEVVVAHGSEPLKYLVPAMSGRRRPLAYYAIGTYSGSGRPAQLRLWRSLLRRADAIAAEGEEVRAECVERLGVPDDRVTVTPNGRDPGEFRPGTAAPAPPPHVVFIGALTSGKGPDRFIEVVDGLRRRGLTFRASIIGDGPLRSALASSAVEAGVTLLGSRADIPDLLRTADLMLFPSRPAGEGMPGVLIEAGLTGVPVVATAVPGVRSIVRDRETGLVVPVDDTGAMVDAAAQLLTDGDRRTAMGEESRRFCSDHFSLDAVGRCWMTLLQPLLDASRPATGRPLRPGAHRELRPQ